MALSKVSGEWTIPNNMSERYAGAMNPIGFAMSDNRYVVAVNDPWGTGLGDGVLRLTLIDAQGTVLATGTLPGMNAYDLDGATASPNLVRIDATHIFDVADASHWIDPTNTALGLQDGSRSRLIRVDDSGFTVEYDVIKGCGPPRDPAAYPDFRVGLAFSLETGGMVITVDRGWLTAIDPVDGTPLWGIFDDWPGNGIEIDWNSIQGTGVAMSWDTALMTVWWDGVGIRKYQVTRSGITPISDVVTDPLVLDLLDLGAVDFLNPYLGPAAVFGARSGTWVGHAATGTDALLDKDAGMSDPTATTSPMLPFVVDVVPSFNSDGKGFRGETALAWTPGRAIQELVLDSKPVGDGSPPDATSVHFNPEGAGIVIRRNHYGDDGSGQATTFHGWILSMFDKPNLTAQLVGSQVWFT